MTEKLQIESASKVFRQLVFCTGSITLQYYVLWIFHFSKTLHPVTPVSIVSYSLYATLLFPFKSTVNIHDRYLTHMFKPHFSWAAGSLLSSSLFNWVRYSVFWRCQFKAFVSFKSSSFVKTFQVLTFEGPTLPSLIFVEWLIWNLSDDCGS